MPNLNILKGLKNVIQSERNAKLADPMYGNDISTTASKPMIKYSERETQLFHALGFEDFLTQEPAVTYRTLALHCFSTGLTSHLAESVRRCYNAMQDGSPYRLTEEFDSLIAMTEMTEVADFNPDDKENLNLRTG
jgi:hypothetical protein